MKKISVINHYKSRYVHQKNSFVRYFIFWGLTAMRWCDMRCYMDAKTFFLFIFWKSVESYRNCVCVSINVVVISSHRFSVEKQIFKLRNSSETMNFPLYFRFCRVVCCKYTFSFREKENEHKNAFIHMERSKMGHCWWKRRLRQAELHGRSQIVHSLVEKCEYILIQTFSISRQSRSSLFSLVLFA